ncbi:guanylate cyclase, putative [Bodo saltans]|uniref:Guanylate cyclase, putative n=1 Tax=Bodo saltans TaxID=75058 RepID=A0A0S4IXI1_BODSA|nr:guanylate cyclase, putative [Bodo saltans]|eukprot:CUG41806.1 guanylate cyclase, putative [Bodo saltans]
MSHTDEQFSRQSLVAAIGNVRGNLQTPVGTSSQESIGDASILFAVVRELGLASISFEDVNDIFHQILKNKVDAPFVSDEPTVTLDELCEWIETISALNDAHSRPGGRPVHRLPSPSTSRQSSTPPAPTSNVQHNSEVAFRVIVEDTVTGIESSRGGTPVPLQVEISTSAKSEKIRESAHSGDQGSSSFFSSLHHAPGQLEEALAHVLITPELQAAIGSQDLGDVLHSLTHRGFGDILSKILLEAVTKPDASVRNVIKSSTQREFNGRKSVVSDARRTLAFSSALALRHVGSGTGASMGILGTLLFVDISGYSAVTNAIEGMGAHALSSVVNGYLEKIVRVIRANGGDVVKFAGDALLAVWCTEGDAANCAAALRAAWTLIRDCGTEPVPQTTLSFGIHCGVAHGRCTSRIFSPRKLRANDMPSHFHFLSGAPLNDVGEACALAARGEVVIHSSVADCFGDDRLALAPVASEQEGEFFQVLAAADVDDWDVAPLPDKTLLGQTSMTAASGDASQVGGQFERYFVPPKVCRVLDSGMDQFFMAEMRELVVLFLHFALCWLHLLWFDEVFHVLENFSCDVVQISDDDKGVHIVAAMNLYLMAERSVHASVGIGLALRAKHCDAHIGVATGTVFCGVLGSTEACQWDISGAACVRAARLMQHAVANDLSVCYDESIFVNARDRSNLKALDPIMVKGSPDPVPVYTLRDAAQHQRASTFQVAERIPMLSFHQSLTPLGLGEASTKRIAALRGNQLCCSHNFVIRILSFSSWNPSVIAKSIDSVNAIIAQRLVPCTPQDGRADRHERDWEVQHGRELPERVEHGAARARVLRAAHAAATAGRPDDRDVVQLLEDREHPPCGHGGAADVPRPPPQRGVCAGDLAAVPREQRGGPAVCADCAQRAVPGPVVGVVPGHRGEEAGAQRALFLHRDVLPALRLPAAGEEVRCVRERAGVRAWRDQRREVRHLFAHCVQHKPDDRLMAFVGRKTNNNVECVVELAKYLQRRAFLNVGADSHTRMRPTHTDEVERMLWGEISSSIRLKAIHVLDHLTPELLTMCKIIATVTEQPLISAFFYSVSKVCEYLTNAELNVEHVRTLDSLWLLKMCEHKCTAHSGGGELDAAVFLVPAMRDITRSLLVPQQRVAINKICGECFAETHPMDHPMQFLVRARHYLFAGMHEEYVQDLRRGWSLLLADGATTKMKDHAVIKGRYFEWMRDVEPGAQVESVLHSSPALIHEFNVCSQATAARKLAGNVSSLIHEFNTFARKRQLQGSLLATSARFGGSRASNVFGVELAILKHVNKLSDIRYLPLELSPAYPSLAEIVQSLQRLLEASENVGLVLQPRGTPASASPVDSLDSESVSVESLLDEVSAAMVTYILSVTYCIDGVNIGANPVAAGSLQPVVQSLKDFAEKLDNAAFRESLLQEKEDTGDDDDTEHPNSQFDEAKIKALVLATLELVTDHVDNAVQPLCESLRQSTDLILETTWRMSVTVRRQMRFTGVCAFGEACRALRDDPVSVERGDVLVSMFENLPTILEVYCPGSAKLQRIFCNGMESYYLGTLQPPETHAKLRRTLAVFWFTWLNCCSQQLLFY